MNYNSNIRLKIIIHNIEDWFMSKSSKYEMEAISKQMQFNANTNNDEKCLLEAFIITMQ